MDRTALLDELARLVGITKEYWDIFGIKHEASYEVIEEVLRSLGFDVSSESSLINYIDLLKNKDWLIPIKPVYVIPHDEQPIRISLSLPDSEVNYIEVDISSDDTKGVIFRGATKEPTISIKKTINGIEYKRLTLQIPQDFRLDLGYYTISVLINNDKTLFSRLIITPQSAYLPDNLKTQKQWGISLNLYSLSSDDNWGVGDIGDLKKCLVSVLERGGSFVGINPLHAITNQKPYGISPYSPITKLFRNFIYIDVEKIDGIAEIRKEDKSLDLLIKDLRDSTFIDYEGVCQIKLKVLKRLFELFYKRHFVNKDDVAKSFQRYLDEKGDALLFFCTFCLLAEMKSKVKPIYDWRQWDEKYHSYNSKEVKAFQQRHKKGILFYAYLQWLLDCQIKEVSDTVKNNPDCIGIYNDIAVGSIRGGSDEWFYKDVFAKNINVGAPPDDFNPTGQDWGFPPLCPNKLMESAYEPLIRYIKENMRYAGAIRIDHALGIFRMFWIPQGRKPAEGVYVEYPFDDILRIISLESHLNKTIVIAEDLGTITDQARKSLKQYKMLSYRLLYFERKYPDVAFKMPEDYPEISISSVTTHDLPTLWGFWYLKDIELRRSLGMFSSEQEYQKAIVDRQRDKALLIEALKGAELLPLDMPVPDDLNDDIVAAIYGFISRSKAMLVAVSLDDIMRTLNQQNMPGTVDEYPCWLQKTPKMIEYLFKDDIFDKVCHMVSKYRKNN
ncbi:MAG: 4-alpha-glucanotransferase [Thermodesulfovibrionales bacterium]|nr:4-alpha-glucanotransferase [Thermodesulfovibrionales bacterium]